MAKDSNSNVQSQSQVGVTKRALRRAVKSPDEILENKVTHSPINNTGNSKNNTPQRRRAKKKSSTKKYIVRFFLTLLTVLVLAVYVVYSLVATIATGPSETLRDQLVLMAMQASATKWVPGLFLSDETVEEIVANSKNVNTETDSLDDYINNTAVDANGEAVDIWENAIDGMIFETISGKTFKAYVLLVKDPSRVFVGTSSDYKSGKEGMTIFNIAKKYDAVAAINGGEFSDPGGVGTGNNPIGITYSQGELMWNDVYTNRTFIGIDKNDRLVVSEGMSKSKAEELGIRDGVCFQTGNVLITSDENTITKHYADNNTGTAQRTAIGQTSDGTLILIVTDGRSASSLGATHNDIIDIMVSYGAVTAGMLDGGSSAMMYYKNYYEKYDYDINELDKYQKQGLVNKYKAFTTPRKIPTYFIVGEEKNYD
ncbi:MAG: phosphodiester glycosidase family protein [Clostridia bacterium]|nr:phosphodiester glycosidase family protein [Clostridia bacterium]